MPCLRKRNRKKSKDSPPKGALNIDLVISASIFIIGVVFFVQIVSYVITSYTIETGQWTKSNLANSVSKVLFGSEGVPNNWDDSPATAKQLGLCVNFTKICLVSSEKLAALGSLSAYAAKSLLNLGDNDFRVSIKDTNNNLLFEYKSADIGQELGIHQYRCLMFDGSLKKIITTVQVW